MSQSSRDEELARQLQRQMILEERVSRQQHGTNQTSQTAPQRGTPNPHIGSMPSRIPSRYPQNPPQSSLSTYSESMSIFLVVLTFDQLQRKNYKTSLTGLEVVDKTMLKDNKKKRKSIAHCNTTMKIIDIYRINIFGAKTRTLWQNLMCLGVTQN
jgi:hypothetical protein